MLGFDADLAPLIDNVDTSSGEKISNGSVGELNLETGDPGLCEQPACLEASSFDVLGKSRHLLEVGIARSKFEARAQVAADIAHNGRSGQHLGGFPAVDGQRE